MEQHLKSACHQSLTNSILSIRKMPMPIPSTAWWPIKPRQIWRQPTLSATPTR